MPDDPDKQLPDAEGFLPADSPPAWGTESRPQRLSRLSAKARNLPPRAGVYLMKDHRGVVVYVGKALRLCDRVASYFVPSADLGFKKQPMLDVVHDIDVLVCDGEWEALLAENRLIKDIRPRFNTRLTDDKTFPYLAVTMGEEFPRVIVTREPSSPEFRGARIFGPFVSVKSLKHAVQIAQRIFRFRTCHLDILQADKKNTFFRPCILHAIGQCTAPCAAKISKDAYRADAERFVKFISTRRADTLREMRAEMDSASKSLNFEKAAVLRDQIRAIERLDERAKRSDQWQPETEVSVLDPKKGLRSLQRVLGIDAPIRCIEGFDIAHLMGGETVASKVCFVDGRPLKSQYRRFRIGKKGRDRGIKPSANHTRVQTTTDAASLDPSSLDPSIPPSHNDDYAAIREVVSRRYRDAGEGHELYPDVILIDGGLGQLHAALQAFAELDIKPPMVISLAKKEELIYIQERKEPIKLGRDNPGLRLVQAIRDEAHRFAQHYHHVLRRKKTLDE
ncbi:MAG: UvrB/UvrC motif-containing protein [Phycisphaerales bacterium]